MKKLFATGGGVPDPIKKPPAKSPATTPKKK
jgi:hypothetical protein